MTDEPQGEGGKGAALSGGIAGDSIRGVTDDADENCAVKLSPISRTFKAVDGEIPGSEELPVSTSIDKGT